MSFDKLRLITKRTLIAINLLAAISLITGCYGKYLNPREFWFTGLFTLGAFYFLLVIIGFIFFWLMAKPFWAFFGIVVIIICWSPLQHLVQLRLSPDFIREKHPQNLRIMSWNVEHFDILEHKTHPERKQQMITMINAYNPDIACFQEVVAGEKKGSINNLDTLMMQLGFKYSHYSYNRKLDFDDDHHFGILIFSRFPVISKHTMSYAPNDYNSIFQFADVVRGSDTFRIFNLHMQSLKFSDKHRSYIEKPTLKDQKDILRSTSILDKLHKGFLKRSEQSERIKQVLDSTRFPSIVAGDFNDVPNSYAYYTIGKDMKSTFAEKGTGIGRTFYSISPTLRIDHIFCDKRFNVEQFVRIKKKLSDHYPVIADFYYTNTTK